MQSLSSILLSIEAQLETESALREVRDSDVCLRRGGALTVFLLYVRGWWLVGRLTVDQRIGQGPRQGSAIARLPGEPRSFDPSLATSVTSPESPVGSIF